MEIQSSYFSYLFAIGLGQTLLLIFALIKNGLKKYLSRIYFLILLSIITIEIFYGLLYQTKTIFEFPHLLRVNTPFVLATGPAIYLSIRHLLSKNNQFNKRDLWHFLPTLLSIAYFIPLYLKSGYSKLSYLEVMYSGVHLDSYILGGLRRIQQVIYVLSSFILIRKSEIQLNTLLAKKFFRALFAVLVLLALMWLWDVYRIFFEFEFLTGIVNTILLSSVLIYLTMKLVAKESFFDDSITPKYASSGLGKKGELQLLDQIDSLFKQEKTFASQALTLTKLAAELSVSPNYVSQSINNRLGISYSDFISQWRIEEAKSLLLEPENDKWTLLYIAQSSGFKSSSAFNSAFKKFTGLTPSQFRNSER